MWDIATIPHVGKPGKSVLKSDGYGSGRCTAVARDTTPSGGLPKDHSRRQRTAGPVAIRLKREEMEVALERAYQLSRDETALPQQWLERVKRIEEAPSKTYVAALGAAMLAKATDDRVDSLSRTADASDRGYSIRGVGEFMATKADIMGFHLGVPGKWPLNNSPFYRNNARIDRFEHIEPRSKPYYDDLVRYLRELDRLPASEALRALAAFLARRIAYADAERSRQREVVVRSARLLDVIEIARLFVTEDAEGGRRGQAFAAAVLDCAYDDVRLRSINNPRPIDVSAWSDGAMRLAVEVKQAIVDESVALALAEDAADAQCDRAVLAALHPQQPHIDKAHLRREALERHGVLVDVAASVEELVATVLLPARLSLTTAAERLQEVVLRRLDEHGLPEETVQRWLGLCAGL